MKPVRLLPVVLLSLVFGSGAGALPAADSLRPLALPWTQIVVLDRFDPALGTLRAVHLRLQSFVEGLARIENLGDLPCNAVLNFGARVQLALPDGSPIVINDHDADMQLALGAFDNDIDYGGASGASPLISGLDHQTVTIDDPLSLLYFTGAYGDPGTVELPISATGAETIESAEPLLYDFTLQAGARVRAEFVYDKHE